MKPDLNKNPYQWYLERTENLFGCPHCGCKITMANVDSEGHLLPGRLCSKCAEPVMVAIEFTDMEAPWKHSKGPWKAVEDKDGNITIQSSERLIATVNVQTVRQARFDAHLMATSPEILFWLGRVVDLVYFKADEKEINEAIAQALIAIAKAEKWAA